MFLKQKKKAKPDIMGTGLKIVGWKKKTTRITTNKIQQQFCFTKVKAVKAHSKFG